MSKDIEVSNASGLFNLKAQENGGEEIMVPVKVQRVEFSSNSLIIKGWNFDYPGELPWGVRFDLPGPIKPGKYSLNSKTAYYNPQNTDESWMATEGELTLEEVDLDTLFVKGRFNFTAVPQESPGHSGKISGSVSMQEYSQNKPKPVI